MHSVVAAMHFIFLPRVSFPFPFPFHPFYFLCGKGNTKYNSALMGLDGKIVHLIMYCAWNQQNFFFLKKKNLNSDIALFFCRKLTASSAAVHISWHPSISLFCILLTVSSFWPAVLHSYSFTGKEWASSLWWVPLIHWQCFLLEGPQGNKKLCRSQAC